MGPLKRWLLPAALLTAAIAATGWWLISWLSEWLSSWLVGQFVEDGGMIQTLAEWAIWLGLLVIKVKITKYIVLVVMGPLFAMVSEAAERELGRPLSPFRLSVWLKEMVRGVRSAALMATVEFSVMVVAWGLGLAFPVVSPATLVISWLVGAWIYGASVMDYVWERRGLGAREGFRQSLRRPSISLGVGIPFSLWMSVPILAWTIGPMIGGLLATIAAAVAIDDRDKSGQLATV